MTVTDVSTFIGEYPYRGLNNTTPEWLLTQMDQCGIDNAWVGHLPSILFKDPEPGNRNLIAALKPFSDRLLPVPTVSPMLPRWEDDLNRSIELGAPAIRVYPMHLGIDPSGGEMRVLAAAAGAAGLPVLLTCKLEDGRQRHPSDMAGELPAGAIRTLVRSDPEIHLLVVHADRSFIEEVHFGLTPGEAARLLWDISWIWGEPSGDLQHLLKAIGTDRFTFGTGMPLRIPDAVLAKLELLDLSDSDRDLLTGSNLRAWSPSLAS